MESASPPDAVKAEYKGWLDSLLLEDFTSLILLFEPGRIGLEEPLEKPSVQVHYTCAAEKEEEQPPMLYRSRAKQM